MIQNIVKATIDNSIDSGLRPLFTTTIGPLPPGQRLSIAAVLRQAGLSQALRRRLKREGRIFVNGTEAQWSTILWGGESLAIFDEPKEPSFEPWDAPLSIVWEDDELLVIDKAAGWLMHPTSTERYHTVANALIHYFESTGQAGASFHPIHRLDKDTSGLVLIGKNSRVQHAFTKQRLPITKIYEALCAGRFPLSQAAVHWPIGRREGSIIERCCTRTGKASHTDIQCLAVYDSYSHIRLYLHTGRTHQIRVHLSHMGYPLLGDDIYGGPLEPLQRQALHARFLSFTHPMTGEFISLEAPLPDDMRELVDAPYPTFTRKKGENTPRGDNDKNN